MKKYPYKLLSFIPLLALTACGYGLQETYEGYPYNSTVFEENYYKVWDESLNNGVTTTLEETVLSDKDSVFTSFNSENFRNCESEWIQYTYDMDKYTSTNEHLKLYGPSVKLSGLDESFKYGITSKLFDGQLFCNGDYQMSRTQVAKSDENTRGGFSTRFSKEMSQGSYFVSNFKCSLVSDVNQYYGNGLSDITLKLNFFVKNNENGLTKIPVSYRIENAPTNSGDGFPLSRFDGYVCFGFKLSEVSNDGLVNLNRLVGMSFEYELNDCTVKVNEGEKEMHALMLYEVSFPYSSWN